MFHSKNLEEVKLKDKIVNIIKEIDSQMIKISDKKIMRNLGILFQNTFEINLYKKEKKVIEFNKELITMASFFLVVQIVTYQLVIKAFNYDRKDTNFLMENFFSISQIEESFRNISMLNPVYKQLYLLNIISLFNSKFLGTLNYAFHELVKIDQHYYNFDIFGKIFYKIMPYKLRKKLATYYTSNAVGKFVAYLSIKNHSDKILDPSCGSGTMLVCSYLRKKFLSEICVHEDIIDSLFGIEISDLAGLLTKVNLALLNPLKITKINNIIINDAFKVHVGTDIPKVDIIIGNPPFTRGDLLSKNYKDFLELHLQEVLKLDFSYNKKHLGLYVYFLLDSLRFLKKDGVIAVILPISLINSSSVRPALDIFLKKFTPVYIISSYGQVAFSEGSAFREIILIARKEKNIQLISKFVLLKRELTIENYAYFGKKIEEINYYLDDDEIRIQPVYSNKLKEDLSLNWILFFYNKSFHQIFLSIKNSPYSISIKELVKDPRYDIDRGFRAGISNFFYLPNNYWDIYTEEKNFIIIKNKEDKTVINVPRTYILPILRKSSLYNKLSPKISEYLLLCPPNSSLTEYINWGREKFSLNEGFELLSFNQVRKGRKIARIGLSHEISLRNGRFIAFYSPVPVVMSDSFIFVRTSNEKMDKILAAYFNSSIFLLTYLILRREKSGKLSQIFGKDFRNFFCINPQKIPKEDQDNLLSIFEIFIRESNSFKSISIQIKEAIKDRKNIRYLLDEKICCILNIGSNYNYILNVYLNLLEELDRLQ